jgi:hypothetical protein
MRAWLLIALAALMSHRRESTAVGAYSRRVVIPGTGHVFSSDPHDEPGSFSGLRPGVSCRLLQERL